ncbi:lactococcin 972 family bacteriocin [Streptomyces sp. CB02923]|uniref:lactococcin 972 family bacteriocin n=1 Tax=Streptomyces sp. CB02923 TaxID=1718985 RepID=UPI00093B18B0|nr:lactococcin 972 family bacteriocin [Streptomyces sp. CB02923]
MRISGRTLALGFASAALTVCSPATPAAADSPQATTVAADGTVITADDSEAGHVTTHKRGDGTEPPAELGNPSEWGVVKIQMTASAHSGRPDQEACVNASGGKWCYGWYTDFNPGKYCYSNYLHETKWHRSSVKLGSGSRSSGSVKPGSASNAHLSAGLAYTCYTYYSID